MPSICIIEDELSIQQMYRFRLEKEGFTVYVASDGQTGLELLKTTLPDLALLDLRMPRMGGEEVLARLRAEPWGSGIKVIILTNISKNEAPSALRFLHVERYIVKVHSTPQQVTEVVRSVLGV